MTTEWDADAYHRVSDPQFAWGLRVLDRLPLEGGESVLDAGCGSGRLTAALARRVPKGRVVAVDRSRAMLQAARCSLTEAPDTRAHFVLADLASLPFATAVDVVFSTATFHWVPDHPALFAGIHHALRPGGRLVAQCGGHGNLARIHQRADALLQHARWRPWFGDWHDPWEFATPEVTRERLAKAGFVEIETWREEAPTTFPTAEAFSSFLTTVVLRLHLARLPGNAARKAFVAELADAAARDTPPFTLDYVRLNIDARRP